METLKQQLNAHASEALVYLWGELWALGAEDIRHRIEQDRGGQGLGGGVREGSASRDPRAA